jgi:D-alanyl-D-alanine dipeptidase
MAKKIDISTMICLLILSASVIGAQTPAGPPTGKGPFQPSALVELVGLDPTIKLDIRYATANNFVGRAVYPEARAFLQRPAAEALLSAHHWLKDKGYGLVVYDAYRPWSVTKLFWDITPPEKRMFVADPAIGSVHNRGCAADVGLYDLKTGRVVEMPSAFDEMTERSFVTYPGGTPEQRARRDLLREAMERGGCFFVYPEEWWHYDFKDFMQYDVLDTPFSALSISPKPVPGIAKSLSRPDLTLHYMDYGRGEPVLLLMGGPGFSGEGLEPVAQMIAKRARAIVPDQRGTGGSIPKNVDRITLDATLADFEALRQSLGFEKWTVWGCSWGGMLALDYASKFPSSIKGLILADSGGPSFAFIKAFSDNMRARKSADDLSAHRYWSQPDVVAKDPMRAVIEMNRAMLPSQFYDRSKAHQVIAILKEGREHYNPELDEILSTAYDKGASARIEALKKVDIPALIIHGRQDPMPESVALENQKLLKGSRLVWLERSGHWPWIEQPEAFEKALFEFLFPVR